jgi:hypothetical protein
MEVGQGPKWGCSAKERKKYIVRESGRARGVLVKLSLDSGEYNEQIIIKSHKFQK